MEKVKVSKEIFDALESFEKRSGEMFKSALNFAVCTNNGLLPEEKILRKNNFELLVDIAYCGYELEETKEDKLLKIYEEHKEAIKKFMHPTIGHKYQYILDGIDTTLQVLDIKIEGINK